MSRCGSRAAFALLAMVSSVAAAQDDWSRAGALPAFAGTGASTVAVAPGALASAVAAAMPGQILELAPGRYEIAKRIAVARPGDGANPIVLRARHLGEVVIRVTATEGFFVQAPHWIFENLVLLGACPRQSDCEHAFHVVGQATASVIRNNCLADFNAPIKVNRLEGDFPDYGLIEHNSLYAHGPRETANPVTLIDIVSANGWMVRANLIMDFAKVSGNHISYGAFMKGGGQGGSFDGNIVACRFRVAPASLFEQRVGLSFGGGGTALPSCRDGQCRFEHSGGLARHNLILNCSDIGLYLNKAAESRVIGNILDHTGGITARFAETRAEIRDNIVDGGLRDRDGAQSVRVNNTSVAIAPPANWPQLVEDRAAVCATAEQAGIP